MKSFISAVMSVLFVIMNAFNLIAYFAKTEPVEYTDEWKQNVIENYNEFIAEVDGDENKIPMIVTTDQHGAITFDNKLYEFVNGFVDWSKVSKIINLGDTVKETFNPVELAAYRKATECLPAEKCIEVIGNHDRFFVKSGKAIEKIFFDNPDAEYSADRRAFVIEDEEYGIRYLAVDPKRFPYNYECGELWTVQADFIIKELSKEDESDLVMISHPYDFSGCKGDFLMTLHGHHHTEGYETKDGITEFLFQSMTLGNAENTEPCCFYFAYIDKNAKTFKCWKNLSGYDAWEISIA